MAIIQNAVRIIEGDKTTYLVSRHTHDFNEYVFKDGSFYAVDGGREYCRRVYSVPQEAMGAIQNWCLSDESPFDEVCQKLLWGTYGKDGNMPLHFIPIASMTQAHLKAIVETQNLAKGSLHEKVIRHFLKNKKITRKHTGIKKA